MSNRSVSPRRGVTFTVWDMGGHKLLRNRLCHYLVGAEGLIFVVDSNDRECIIEARDELHDILESPDMSKIPIVIIANKRDAPDAMTSSEIIEKLGMEGLRSQHKYHLQSACALTGDGLIDSIGEMANLVKQYREENN